MNQVVRVLTVLCAKRRHRVLIGSVSLPLLLMLVKDPKHREMIDPLLRRLDFCHGADDAKVCPGGDLVMMKDWFELNRALASQSRLEQRLLRRSRQSWEPAQTHDKLRYLRLARLRKMMGPSFLLRDSESDNAGKRYLSYLQLLSSHTHMHAREKQDAYAELKLQSFLATPGPPTAHRAPFDPPTAKRTSVSWCCCFRVHACGFSFVTFLVCCCSPCRGGPPCYKAAIHLQLTLGNRRGSIVVLLRPLFHRLLVCRLPSGPETAGCRRRQRTVVMHSSNQAQRRESSCSGRRKSWRSCTHGA